MKAVNILEGITKNVEGDPFTVNLFKNDGEETSARDLVTESKIFMERNPFTAAADSPVHLYVPAYVEYENGASGKLDINPVFGLVKEPTNGVFTKIFLPPRLGGDPKRSVFANMDFAYYAAGIPNPKVCIPASKEMNLWSRTPESDPFADVFWGEYYHIPDSIYRVLEKWKPWNGLPFSGIRYERLASPFCREEQLRDILESEEASERLRRRFFYAIFSKLFRYDRTREFIFDKEERERLESEERAVKLRMLELLAFAMFTSDQRKEINVDLDARDAYLFFEEFPLVHYSNDGKLWERIFVERAEAVDRIIDRAYELTVESALRGRTDPASLPPYFALPFLGRLFERNMERSVKLAKEAAKTALTDIPYWFPDFEDVELLTKGYLLSAAAYQKWRYEEMERRKNSG